MGVFDWMMKGVGFEKDNEEDAVLSDAKGINKEIQPESEADVKRRKDAFKRLTGSKEEKESETVSTINSGGKGTKTVAVYTIKTNQDIEVVIDALKNRQPAIVNLSKVDKKEIMRVQDFLSGCVFALNANISLLINEMYLITPQGITIKKA